MQNLLPRLARRRSSLLARSLYRRNVWVCIDTPNPKVRKFEHDETLACDLDGARNELLAVVGVKDVFVARSAGSNPAPPWVSVTRAEDVTWEALTPQLQSLLAQLSSSPAVDQRITLAPAAADRSGVEIDIAECLDDRIRPSVQADGGDVELLRWDASSGEVTLSLRGACRGCPQSAVTLQENILRTLQHYVPVVKSVASEEETLETSDDPTADIAWNHNGQPDGTLVALAASGTPFFSAFAGIKVEGKMLRRIKFSSELDLMGRRPGHVHIHCVDCGARRSLEDPSDLLREDKGNTTGNAAVAICPACCVIVNR